MTLAGILTLCMLVAAPAAVHTLAPVNWQAQQPESPPANPTPDEAKPPESESAPAQTASPEPAPVPEGAKPVEQKPPSGKPSAAKKTKTKKRKPQSPSTTDAPKRVVVRNGSTSEAAVQLAPHMTQEQATHQRQNTNQLLTSTEDNLKKVEGRQLNPGQQDLVKQIRTYMDQARKATDDGDLQRAHTLAMKAHLLSDDLVKH